MKSASPRFLLLVALLLFCHAEFSAAQGYIKPYSGTFNPFGTLDSPINNFYGAVNAGRASSYELLGDTPVYGSGRLDVPVRLTRNPGNGVPMKIGAAAVAQTTFRCIAYNCRLGDPNPLSSGWASPQRAAVIRNHAWGTWDAFGFCEVWDIADSYNNHIRLMGFGASRTITGLDAGGSPQHGGLVLHARHDLSNTFRGVYQACAHALEDCLANKGWVRGRMVKDGFGIWVFMTHTQADASVTGFGATTWSTIYSSRKAQLEQLRDDVKSIQNNPAFANDVIFLMGDFNVVGEDRNPPGSPAQNEYSTVMADVLGPQISGGMDVARNILPLNRLHTFSHTNTLTKYYYPTLDEATSGRLDYIIAVNSKNGNVVIEPTRYEVLYPQSGGFTSDGTTSTELSDHWPVTAEFRIFRRSN